ncbi:MAG TPA: YceH family protein [Acidobacteriaceae bacterium]|nr:YceH family protein [Acidobacteriaceae bacterium]
MLTLTAAEVRVLGALIEKGITTPEYYPLSLNALVNACNQKSSRDPVMELSEADARTALFELEQLGLVRVQADSRVSKFEHLAYGKLGLGRPETAVLGLLLLRGPQTAAELRARAERMYTFDDVAAVTAVLDRLAAREEPLVVQLARQPGARESRWIHRLSGEVEAHSAAGVGAVPMAAPASDLQRRIGELEQLVQALEERVRALEGTSQASPG